MCANSPLERVRLKGRLEQSQNEIELLKEEIRIKDARMKRIRSKHRPYYSPFDRLNILELKAARGWNCVQTAETFLVEPETVSIWIKRLDEKGMHALCKLREPVNKFSDLCRYITQRLKILCPSMGKKKIADLLTRAGLKISSSSVGRFIISEPAPDPLLPDQKQHSVQKKIISKYPNHIWLVDMTLIPTSKGFWASWFPFSFVQCWPFCYWVAVAVDHFSRTCIGYSVFKKQPSSEDITAFLSRTIKSSQTKPRHIISDKGKQFFCRHFKNWCKQENIKPRFGAVGRYGSISIVERFIKTLKSECTRKTLNPMNIDDFRYQITEYLNWYNEFRPHESLKGRTPFDAYFGKRRRNGYYKMKGPDPDNLVLQVSYVNGQKHLPVIKLRKTA